MKIELTVHLGTLLTHCTHMHNFFYHHRFIYIGHLKNKSMTSSFMDRQGHKWEVTALNMGTDIQLLKGKRFKSSLRLKPIKVHQGCSVQANPSRRVGRVPVQSRQVVTLPAPPLPPVLL